MSSPPLVRLVVCLLSALAWPMFALAAGTITVDGSCSLTDAIRSANADADLGGCVGAGGDETLILDADAELSAADTVHSTPRLGSFAGLPDVTSAMTIQAGSAVSIRRDAALGCTASNQFRIFNVLSGGDLTLIDVEIENGCAANHGGAALVNGDGSANGSLRLNGVTFRGNRVGGLAEGSQGLGGAIFVGSDGEIPSIELSRFESNEALGGFGGGIAAGSATGGAIHFGASESPAGTIADTTFTGNRAVGGLSTTEGGFGSGGAIYSNRPLGLVEQSTFEGNEAIGGDGNTIPGEGSGGGLHLQINSGSEPTQLVGLLITGNRSTGGGTAALDVPGGAGISSGAYLRAVPPAPIVFEGSRITGGTTLGGSGGPAGDGRCSLYALTATTVRSSTVDNNLVRGGSSTFSFGGSAFGGGACGDDDAFFSAVTLSGNVVQGGPSLLGTGGFGGGGGWSTFGTAESTLEHLTITDNRAIAGPGNPNGESRAGGLYFAWFSDFRSSLVAGNVIVDAAGVETANDCSINQFGSSGGFNLVQAPGDCADDLTLPGDQMFLDPQLAILEQYGCVTPLPNGLCAPTHAVPLGSPAIDIGTCDGATPGDGRSFSRPIDIAAVVNADDGCDVGAYESRDEDGSGEDDGIDFVFIFDDGFESGDLSAWTSSSP